VQSIGALPPQGASYHPKRETAAFLLAIIAAFARLEILSGRKPWIVYRETVGIYHRGEHLGRAADETRLWGRARLPFDGDGRGHALQTPSGWLRRQ
jgi:hypothetical protein